MTTLPTEAQPIGWRQQLARVLRYSGVLRASESVCRSHKLERTGEGFSGWNLRRVSGLRAVILCYHGVGSNGFPLYSDVRVPVFDAQMRYVCEHYRVISLHDLCRELR